MVPVLGNQDFPDKNYTYSRWFDGESVKDDRFRYTEWLDEEGNVITRMLYDHQSDPKENIKIAELPENKDLINKFSKQLESIRTLP